jgi:SulP family sulfate permease
MAQSDMSRVAATAFTPKLVTVLREGYGLAQFRADALAGLTVAIVALPLSMAIAIASGVGPERGLYAAIVGGFFVSALGGSRYQIGGPAGAFIVLVAATVARHGVDGLILATMLSGLMLTVCGWLRVGSYIRFIPFPVTVGFTAGIAVIIFMSQITPLLGLVPVVPEPSAIPEKIPVLIASAHTLNPAAVVVALATIAIIVLQRSYAPKLPGMLIAITLAAAASALLDLPVETIATRFGALPSGLMAPALPEITWAKVEAVLPDAVAFTLLGAIESLLSAVVADGMTGRRHRSNGELVAQGVANVASGLFGGFCVTGTIARTATNVRAGAVGPVSGMLHAAFLLLFMAVAAPLAGYIPLAALAGVLATVAWTMAERHAFAALLTGPRGDALVLMSTFLLTVFRDLTEAIVVGFALGSVMFIHRMSELTAVEARAATRRREGAEGASLHEDDPDIVVHRVSGALFFGAASIMDAALDQIGDRHKVTVIDLSGTPLMDSSGAHSLAGIAQREARRGIAVWIAGASAQARTALFAQGLKPPAVHYAATVEDAVETARAAA